MNELDNLHIEFHAMMDAHEVTDNDRIRHQRTGNTEAQLLAQQRMTRFGRLAVEGLLRKIPDFMKCQYSDPKSFDLTTECPLCGYKIPPSELLRTGWASIKCPKCEGEFEQTSPR
jgi:hypothetical protein